jgi:hypothetical protein
MKGRKPEIQHTGLDTLQEGTKHYYWSLLTAARYRGRSGRHSTLQVASGGIDSEIGACSANVKSR